MKNKAQAGNITMIVVFVAILMIIASGIVIGISAFFSSEDAFRKTDAEVLNTKIKNCFIENSVSEKLDIYELCSLNEEVIKRNYIIEIKQNGEAFYNYGDTEKCLLGDENQAFPICSTSTLKKDEKTFTITTGSNQLSKIEQK
ncbi:hypothetical protein HY450_03890 [Candidatus Pacearchaeota archaeon]|nr:hypothetical protein [Candidatus Pacearchaeota archaeon]